MKQNFIVISLLVMSIVLPFVTSLLLDWQFIAAQQVRKVLVYLLMIIEFLLTILVLINYLKTTSSN